MESQPNHELIFPLKINDSKMNFKFILARKRGYHISLFEFIFVDNKNLKGFFIKKTTSNTHIFVS